MESQRAACDADDVSDAAAAAIFTEQMVGRNERGYSASWKAKQINLVYNETTDVEPVRRLHCFGSSRGPHQRDGIAARCRVLTLLRSFWCFYFKRWIGFNKKISHK